jgi:tetratricopeptide (TPR) repeat protein
VQTLTNSCLLARAGISILFAMVICGCSKKPVSSGSGKDPDSHSHSHAAEFVGSSSCVECHQEAQKDWHGSHHQLAMQEANADTVLGNFDDAGYEHFGIKSRFFRKDDKFFVNTEGPDGKNADFQVDYVLGVYPLQQYMIKFPRGHVQVLQLCWDSRPEEDGGQRWYHLYPNEAIDHKDVLHWTGEHFNWNYMCADCHTTNLKKNFDVGTRSYNTTWSEINVGCEACHGHGSRHIDWAKSNPDITGELTEKKMGLAATLKDSKPSTWFIHPKTRQPVRSLAKESDAQVNACARCHSHRRLIQGIFSHGQDFLDTHKPAVLEDRLYHHDGQIDEEVYVYGSFVQSKMYNHGVRCSDCHNPHSLKLHAPGNALCVRCHDGSKYMSPDHHHHKMGTTGAACVECHMPHKNFMVVDARRDHSIRIPRPDLSKKLGTPNACNMCHKDKDNTWTADAFSKWYPERLKKTHYGEILAAANKGEAGAGDKLIKLASKSDIPPIVRATVMWQLQNHPTQAAMQTLLSGLENPEAIVREASIAGFSRVQPRQKLELLAPLLSDPCRSVRTETVRVLARIPANLFNTAQRNAYLQAEEEFIAQQEAVSDRAGGHMGLGIHHSDRGNYARAEAAYRRAFAVSPRHVESRLNLAEMMYQQGKQEEALREIQSAVDVQPDSSLTHEALGRYYIRQKNYDKGLKRIGVAVKLSPERPDLRYLYGVGLNQVGKFEQALEHLVKAHQLAPAHADYLVGLATICRDNQKAEDARAYARKLVDLEPENEGYRRLLFEIINTKP